MTTQAQITELKNHVRTAVSDLAALQALLKTIESEVDALTPSAAGTEALGQKLLGT